jgi:hypothetical protein
MYIVRSGEAEDPRRRALIQALVAGLFSSGALPGCAFSQSAFGARPSKLPEGQSIYRLAGDVQVNDKPANLQTRIGPTDTIQTGKDGEIVYIVGDNSFILRGASRLTLEAPDSRSPLLSGFRLVTGALLSVFPRRRALKLATQTATIGIRGTGVYLEAEPKRTYFCTCYGVADVAATNDQQSKDTVSATHHDRPLYILADEQPGRNIRRAPLVNHTDQELMLIETLVGRTPPFVFPKDDYTGPRREY